MRPTTARTDCIGGIRLGRAAPASIPSSLLLIAALAPAAGAKTLHVPKQHATIQAAVDASAVGDVIQVSSGFYKENVLVAVEHTGITIKAKGHVIVDARPQGQIATGPAFKILAEDVTLQGIEMHHANGSGEDADGVNCGVGGLTMRNCVIRHSQGRAVFANGADVTITDCEFAGNNGGVRIQGTGATVRNVTLSNDGDRGIVISGDGATVLKCKLSVIEDGRGVEISGDNARVESCSFNDTDNEAVRVSGSNFVIKNCKLRSIGENADGIEIGSNATSGRIEDCPSEHVCESGLRIDGSGVTIKDIKIARCGCEDEPGVRLVGNGNLLTRVSVRGCQGDGFRMEGNGNQLTNCTSVDNGEDGFQIATGKIGNELDSCVASANLAEGIENGGTDSVVRKCVARKNRIDLANTGTFTDYGANKIGRGGQSTLPEIDDG